MEGIFYFGKILENNKIVGNTLRTDIDTAKRYIELLSQNKDVKLTFSMVSTEAAFGCKDIKSIFTVLNDFEESQMSGVIAYILYDEKKDVIDFYYNAPNEEGVILLKNQFITYELKYFCSIVLDENLEAVKILTEIFMGKLQKIGIQRLVIGEFYNEFNFHTYEENIEIVKRLFIKLTQKYPRNKAWGIISEYMERDYSYPYMDQILSDLSHFVANY